MRRRRPSVAAHRVAGLRPKWWRVFPLTIEIPIPVFLWNSLLIVSSQIVSFTIPRLFISNVSIPNPLPRTIARLEPVAIVYKHTSSPSSQVPITTAPPAEATAVEESCSRGSIRNRRRSRQRTISRVSSHSGKVQISRLSIARFPRVSYWWRSRPISYRRREPPISTVNVLSSRPVAISISFQEVSISQFTRFAASCKPSPTRCKSAATWAVRSSLGTSRSFPGNVALWTRIAM